MEKYKKILTPLLGALLIAAAFLFYSVISEKAATEQRIPTPVVLPEYIRAQSKVWTYTKGMTLESSTRFALVPGDPTVSLELYVEAPTDENGAIIYDDGQNWTLVLRKGRTFYPLMEKQFIQNGKVYYSVFYSYEDNTIHILVSKNQRADLEIYECVYDIHEDAFEVRNIHRAKDIEELYRNY